MTVISGRSYEATDTTYHTYGHIIPSDWIDVEPYTAWVMGEEEMTVAANLNLARCPHQGLSAGWIYDDLKTWRRRSCLLS